jgi:hypothetical protein
MIKLSEISYREEDWSEEIEDRYLVNMTFEDGAYTVAAYEKMGGHYGVPDTKLRYGDINKAKKRYKDLIRKYRKMCESMKLRIKESDYDTAVSNSGEYFGVDIFDDYDSIIVYSKDYAYIEKVYDLMYSYASDWADDHYNDIDKYGDSIVNTCFDYIEDKLYRRGLRDFESDFIKSRKSIDRDTATLKDGTVVEIIEKIDLGKMI